MLASIRQSVVDLVFVECVRAVTDSVSLLAAVVACPVALGLRAVHRHVALLAAVVALLCLSSSLRAWVGAVASDVALLAAVVTRLAVVARRCNVILGAVWAVATQVVWAVADAARLYLGGTLAAFRLGFGVVGAVPLQVFGATANVAFACRSVVLLGAIILWAVALQVADLAADMALLLGEPPAATTTAAVAVAVAAARLRALTTQVSDLSAVVALAVLVAIPDLFLRAIASYVAGLAAVVALTERDAILARGLGALVLDVARLVAVPADRHCVQAGG